MSIKKHNRGFTLVEMLVAVSLFTIVAFIVTTTFITMIDAYRRSQNIRLVVENLNFAMDSITLRLREGSGYQCMGGDRIAESCESTEGSYGSYVGIQFTTAEARTLGYFWGKDESGLGRLMQCDGNCDINATYTPITSAQVDISYVRFNVINDPGRQPRVRVLLMGESGPEKNKTQLVIQTTVSQRNIDQL